jgi:multisubunit Na+/H+ antiporter MnhG subunit
MDKLKLDKITLKSFGITMGVVFFVLAGIFFFKQKHFFMRNNLIVAGVFILAGLVLPILLKPIYIVWMRLAFILGWVNTRLILIILFYLVFTPLALLMRLFKIDLLERKNKDITYWKKKEKTDFNISNYERRF